MKKEYINPAMQVVMLQYQTQLLQSSRISSVNSYFDGDDSTLGNIILGEGGSESAR
jgi:hypothetical protein